MSARSKDMIGATLISAGIPMAGEIHLAAGPSTAAFASYWKDWFENDRYHDSTNNISVGEDALVAGRNDVLLVAPGTHTVSTSLAWDKDLTHLVGAGVVCKQPSAILQVSGAVAPMIDVQSSGTIISGITMRNGQDASAVTTIVPCLRLSSAGSLFTLRNSWIWGPEDDTVNDSTVFRLIDFNGGSFLVQDCLIGDGYDINSTGVDYYSGLVKFHKTGLAGSFERCDFVMGGGTPTQTAFLMFDYSPWGFVTFRSCQFIQTSTVSMTHAIYSWTAAAGGNCFAGDGANRAGTAMFDANCFFKGVTDIGTASAEGCFHFPGHYLNASSDATSHAIKLGLSNIHDHTSG